MTLEEIRQLAIASTEARYAFDTHMFRLSADRLEDTFRYMATCTEESGRWSTTMRIIAKKPIPGTARVDMFSEMIDLMSGRLTHAVIFECPAVFGMVEAHLRRDGDSLNWHGPIMWSEDEEPDKRTLGSVDLVVQGTVIEHHHNAKSECTWEEMRQLSKRHGWNFDEGRQSE